MLSGNESRDVLGDSRKRYRCPWAEIGKYGQCKEKFIEQAALKDEKRISVDSLLEVLYIIGRSFTVWIYFPLLNTELFC